jgi:TetR/AcrR family transcriptional repressor of nem operon
MARNREFDTDQVLDDAMELFWVNGFGATSTQDLCERTGLGRGSLYNAFSGKRQLYGRVLERYRESGTAPLLSVLEGPGSARDRLRAMMLRVIDLDLADPDRKGCLAINAAVELAGRDPEVKEAVRQHFAHVEAAILAVIREGQRSGELNRHRDASQVARTVMSTYYGLRVLAKVSDEREALTDVVEGALAQL